MKGRTVAVTRAAFRADGGEIATADTAGNLRFWNTTDGARQDLLGAHEGAVTALVYLPGGKQLVSAGADGVLRLWQLPLPPPAKSLDGPAAKSAAMFVSAGAKTVGWATADGGVTLLDRASGKTIAALKGRGRPVSALGLSPDETLVAMGDEDGTLRVAQTTDGKEPIALPGHTGRVTALAFHPKGTFLASAGVDGAIRLWRLAVLRKALVDPAARLRLLAPKPEKPVAPKPGSAPPLEEEPVLAQLVPVPGGASSVAFAPDGSRLFCGAADKQVRVWNVDQLAVKGQPNPPAPNVLAHTGAVTCLGLTQDGQTLFAGAADNTIRAWNVGNSQVLVDLKHSGPVRGLAVSPDGTRLAAVADDGALYVWNPKARQPLQRFFLAPGHPLGASPANGRGESCLAFLSDNKTILAGDAGGSLREYAISASNLLMADAGKVGALVLMPDGKSLASGGDDGTLKLWELAQLAAGPSDANNPPAPNSGSRWAAARAEWWPWPCGATVEWRPP